MSAAQISTEKIPDTESLGTGDHPRPVSQNLRNVVRSVKRPCTQGHQSSLGVRSICVTFHSSAGTTRVRSAWLVRSSFPLPPHPHLLWFLLLFRIILRSWLFATTSNQAALGNEAPDSAQPPIPPFRALLFSHCLPRRLLSNYSHFHLSWSTRPSAEDQRGVFQPPTDCSGLLRHVFA